MSRRLTSQGCSWLERVALRASAALRCPPPAWWKTMVSFRKIYRASFVANEFSQISKDRPVAAPASGSNALVFAIFDESRLVVEFGRFSISEVLLSGEM